MDGPASVMDASTFYNLTTNVSNVIIEAELDVEMPQGTELWLTAESRLGHSEGAIRLQGSGQSHRLVSAIARGLENGRGLTYEFVVREDVRSLLLQTRRVTLALIDAETGRRQEVVQTVVFGVSTSAEAGRSYVSGVD